MELHFKKDGAFLIGLGIVVIGYVRDLHTPCVEDGSHHTSVIDTNLANGLLRSGNSKTTRRYTIDSGDAESAAFRNTDSKDAPGKDTDRVRVF